MVRELTEGAERTVDETMTMRTRANVILEFMMLKNESWSLKTQNSRIVKRKISGNLNDREMMID